MKRVQNEYGFTLVEMMVASATLSILALAMFGAIQVMTQSTRLAQAKTRVQSTVRDSIPVITREIEVAARAATAAGIPGVTGVQVFDDGDLVGPDELGDMVVFQVPLDNTGQNWSTPIQFRFVNEDQNGNGYLDDGEDTVDAQDPTQDGNGDGVLTRWIVREQDTDGDGNFDGPGERRVVGGVNEFQSVQYSLNAARDFLTITVVSQQVMENTGRVREADLPNGGTEMRRQGQMLRAQAAAQIYILN